MNHFRIPSTDQNRYRTVKRGPSKQLLIPDNGLTAVADVEFPDEYCFFKIRLEDDNGMAAGTDVEFMVNSGPWHDTYGDPIILENAAAPYTWVVATLVGTAFMNLRLSVATTEPLTFTITPYERVEW